MRYHADKHFLAQIWQFKSHNDLENDVKVTKILCANVISMQIWLKSANLIVRYCAYKKLSC